jgi:hypothetical protein
MANSFQSAQLMLFQPAKVNVVATSQASIRGNRLPLM